MGPQAEPGLFWGGFPAPRSSPVRIFFGAEAKIYPFWRAFWGGPRKWSVFFWGVEGGRGESRGEGGKSRKGKQGRKSEERNKESKIQMAEGEQEGDQEGEGDVEGAGEAGM